MKLFYLFFAICSLHGFITPSQNSNTQPPACPSVVRATALAKAQAAERAIFADTLAALNALHQSTEAVTILLSYFPNAGTDNDCSNVGEA